MNRPQGMVTDSLATATAMENVSSEIADALLRVDRLSTLPKPCLAALAKAADIVDYKAGAVIVGRDSQPVVLFLLQGRVIVKHSNGTSLRYESNDEPVARPLYRAGEQVEIIAARAVRLLQIPNADYVRQLSLASSMSNDIEFEVVDGNPHELDGLERALRVGALAQVPPEHVQQILLRFEERMAAAGEPVYEQGQVADGFFILQSGAAEMHRIEADVRTVGSPAKAHFNRLRPLIGNDKPICVPREDWMKTNMSYPSGHSMTVWAWALILTEAAPERADDLLRVGREGGDSRVVCGVHFPSDVEAGRTVAAGMVARLHADQEFMGDLARVKAEVAAAKPLRCPS